MNRDDHRAAGYSGTPLVRKLGLEAGMTCAAVDPPEHYLELLVGLPDDLRVGVLSDSAHDFVHVFVRERTGLAGALRVLRERIAPNGMIWVSWPKRASGVDTDVTEDVVRQAGLSVGLVDVKVCAVDETWSGLKFVIPVAARPAIASRHDR
jgi:hypothetical protein